MATLAAATLIVVIGPEPAGAHAPRCVKADAKFLQGMIAHQAQARRQEVEQAAGQAKDAARVRKLAAAVPDLAKA